MVFSGNELKTLQDNVKKTTNSFIDGFREAVEDLSALEVNTMIVSEINGLKFNPQNAYRALYSLLNDIDYSTGEAVHSAQGELNFTNNTLKKLKRNLMGEVQDVLNDRTVTDLPSPGSEKFNALLQNKRFVRSLRKLDELRSLTDKPQFNESGNIYDNIYAQTIIQLDGDVLNYFHRRLLEEEHEDQRNFLITIHKEAVISSQKNWQDILHLIFDMLSQIPKIFSRSA